MTEQRAVGGVDPGGLRCIDQAFEPSGRAGYFNSTQAKGVLTG